MESMRYDHSLDVSKTTRPVKQKLRHFAKNHNKVIMVEVQELLAAEFIRECKPGLSRKLQLGNLYRLHRSQQALP
jgi:mRNA-degrading endonuclease RelE of RelBE toxin-antitoxin system